MYLVYFDGKVDNENQCWFPHTKYGMLMSKILENGIRKRWTVLNSKQKKSFFIFD